MNSYTHKGILCLWLICAWALSLQGQELWMKPDKTLYKPGDTATIHFMVGNNFLGDTWNLRKERIAKATLYHNNQEIDIKPLLAEGKEDHIKLYLKQAGTYLFAMESTSAFVELPADRFNAYLKEHALDAVYNQRKNADQLDVPGRERYARTAKTVIQVTQKQDDSYKKNTGMSLEVIPETNPATYQVGDLVYFKLLYDGKPLFGARAFVWNIKNNRLFTQPIYAQQDGRIEVRVFNDGDWMVSVVHMVPSSAGTADWQSYWGTFFFQVKSTP